MELEIENVIVEEEHDENDDDDDDDEEEENDTVEEIEEDGKIYLRSKNSGLIYSSESLENPVVLGIWNRVTEKIDFSYEQNSDDDDK